MHRTNSLFRTGIFVALYFAWVLLLFREYRYNFPPRYLYFGKGTEPTVVELARPICNALVSLSIITPSFVWFLYVFVFTLDAYLLQIYVESFGYSQKYSFFAAMGFLFSPVVIYTICSANYFPTMFHDSFVFLALFVSLLLLQRNPNAALWFQLVTVLVKESVPFLVFMFYFLRGQSSLAMVVRNIRTKIRAVLPLAFVVVLYLSLRFVIAPRLTSREIYSQNPFEASSLFAFHGIPIFVLILHTGMSLYIFWIGVGVLYQPRYRDLLFLFIAYAGLIMLFGYFWEPNKFFLFLPFVLPPFFNFLQDYTED